MRAPSAPPPVSPNSSGAANTIDLYDGSGHSAAQPIARPYAVRVVQSFIDDVVVRGSELSVLQQSLLGASALGLGAVLLVHGGLLAPAVAVAASGGFLGHGGCARHHDERARLLDAAQDAAPQQTYAQLQHNLDQLERHRARLIAGMPRLQQHYDRTRAALLAQQRAGSAAMLAQLWRRVRLEVDDPEHLNTVAALELLNADEVQQQVATDIDLRQQLRTLYNYLILRQERQNDGARAE